VHETANTGADPKPKRPRRWTKRSATTNDNSPNASLSARDVHLLIREVDNYLGRIRGVRGREIAMQRRHAQKLIDKLHQVKWSP